MRTTPSIQSLQIDEGDYGLSHLFVSLYVDDALIYIERPETSVPVLLNVIDLFSKFSEYKLI